MRLGFLRQYSQAIALIIALLFVSCDRSSDEAPVIPPPTNPMIREFIGYGVVNASFIHVANEPLNEVNSLGYLRKRSLVKLIERRSLSNRGNVEIWVKIDAEYSGAPEGRIQGWLRESNLDVYENEAQAVTASYVMTP